MIRKLRLKKTCGTVSPENTDVSFNLDNGKVSVNLKREFLPGYQTPAVSYATAPIFSRECGFMVYYSNKSSASHYYDSPVTRVPPFLLCFTSEEKTP